MSEKTKLGGPLDLATRFARALHREDYDVVRALLTPDCWYETREAPVSGADEIVASYRQANRRARALFDLVEYESLVLLTTPTTAMISFSDRLTKNDRHHVYSCQQELLFTPGALICRIVHRELPEERARLLEFCGACGISLA